MTGVDGIPGREKTCSGHDEACVTCIRRWKQLMIRHPAATQAIAYLVDAGKMKVGEGKFCSPVTHNMCPFLHADLARMVQAPAEATLSKEQRISPPRPLMRIISDRPSPRAQLVHPRGLSPASQPAWMI